jgi:hypothetical protein
MVIVVVAAVVTFPLSVVVDVVVVGVDPSDVKEKAVEVFARVIALQETPSVVLRSVTNTETHFVPGAPINEEFTIAGQSTTAEIVVESFETQPSPARRLPVRNKPSWQALAENTAWAAPALGTTPIPIASNPSMTRRFIGFLLAQ